MIKSAVKKRCPALAAVMDMMILRWIAEVVQEFNAPRQIYTPMPILVCLMWSWRPPHMFGGLTSNLTRCSDFGEKQIFSWPSALSHFVLYWRFSHSFVLCSETMSSIKSENCYYHIIGQEKGPNMSRSTLYQPNVSFVLLKCDALLEWAASSFVTNIYRFSKFELKRVMLTRVMQPFHLATQRTVRRDLKNRLSKRPGLVL